MKKENGIVQEKIQTIVEDLFTKNFVYELTTMCYSYYLQGFNDCKTLKGHSMTKQGVEERVRKKLGEIGVL